MFSSKSLLAIALLLALLLIFGSISLACTSKVAAPSQQPADNKTEQVNPAQESVSPGLLGQDLALLKDSNGKIVNSQTLQTDVVEIDKIRYLSDGLEVVGFLLKPTVNASKCPVIIYNRGGNGDEWGKIGPADLEFLSYFAQHGFVVLASQYRGNDGGEGKEDFGGNDIDDVLNLILLAQSLPFVSPNDIFMAGISRGGLMTYIALSKTDKIRAAAVYSGCTDIIQTYNELPSMKQVLIDLIGGTPTEKKAEYEARSAIYWPEKINTPVLILHGDADQNVNISQARNLAGKLKSLGKTYELVVYPHGDHVFTGHLADVQIRTYDWFAKYLPDFQTIQIPQTPQVFIGIVMTNIDQKLASTLNLTVESGVYVTKVLQDSPAEKAGIKPSGLDSQGQPAAGGDIITQIDNVPVAKWEDISGYLKRKKVGDVISLSIYRGTQKITISVKLEGLPLPSIEGQ
jgi:dienelactone hydrolase